MCHQVRSAGRRLVGVAALLPVALPKGLKAVIASIPMNGVGGVVTAIKAVGGSPAASSVSPVKRGLTVAQEREFRPSGPFG